MKNRHLNNVKTIKTVLILFLLTFTSFTHAQTAFSKKNVIPEDTLYEKLEEFRLVGKMYELHTRCGCSLPERKPWNYQEEVIARKMHSKAYPNPASVSTELEIETPADGFFEINLLNVNGQLIQPVFSGSLLGGRHNYSIEMLTLPAGMYFLTIHSEKYSATVKVMKM